MCGAAALPVLKFIAPIVLPQLANRIFGGGNRPADAAPANFKQTAAPGTKIAGAQTQLGEDEQQKEETEKSETKLNKNQLRMKKTQSNPFKDLGASKVPFAEAMTSGLGQDTGGINPGTIQPAGGY
tara:strand:- start:201 stop:578 length:378 start_codon:yes stop_codon:yes gene_type:complete